MSQDMLFLIGVVFVGVLALLNAWRGAILLRSGDSAGGRKHMVLGLSMLMLIAAVSYYRGG